MFRIQYGERTKLKLYEIITYEIFSMRNITKLRYLHAGMFVALLVRRPVVSMNIIISTADLSNHLLLCSKCAKCMSWDKTIGGMLCRYKHYSYCKYNGQ